MNISLIVNPVAAAGKAKKMGSPAAKMLEEKGCNIEYLVSQYPGHPMKLSYEALNKGADIIVAAGGDGTVSEVANSLVGTKTPLGILPFGRGNDISMSLDIPSDLDKAVDIILSRKIRTIDVGKVKDRYFLGIGGAGFDGEVVNLANRYRSLLPSPFLAYIVGMVVELIMFTPRVITVDIDGDRHDFKAYMVMVGNGPQYGGGMIALPGASLVDGELDICIIKDITKLDFLKTFPKVFKGNHIYHPGVAILKGKKITLSSESQLFTHADGEILGHLPSTFEVLPAKLNVVSP